MIERGAAALERKRAAKRRESSFRLPRWQSSTDCAVTATLERSGDVQGHPRYCLLRFLRFQVAEVFNHLLSE